MNQVAWQGGVSVHQLEEDRQLVSPPEILQAMVGRDHGYLVLGGKSLSRQTRITAFPRSSRLGHLVVNQYGDTFQDGRKVTVVAYEAVVLNAGGEEVTLIIEFDLEGLAGRLEGR